MREEDFVAHCVHELRAPIAILKGAAEMLQQHPDLPAHTVRQMIDKMVQHSERLDHLVHTLLRLADVTDGSLLPLQPCDLMAMVHGCSQLLTASHPSAQIQIDCASPECRVRADPDALELALMNLLDNAVKYSPSPASIQVAIDRVGGRMRVDVTDQGMGIAEEHLLRIFDRFYAVSKAQSRRMGGAGLGLSLVKAVIERHGGSISVASIVGKGSTFTVLLPIET